MKIIEAAIYRHFCKKAKSKKLGKIHKNWIYTLQATRNRMEQISRLLFQEAWRNLFKL